MPQKTLLDKANFEWENTFGIIERKAFSPSFQSWDQQCLPETKTGDLNEGGVRDRVQIMATGRRTATMVSIHLACQGLLLVLDVQWRKKRRGEKYTAKFAWQGGQQKPIPPPAQAE